MRPVLISRAKSKPEFSKNYTSTTHLYTDEDEDGELDEMDDYDEYDDSDDYDEEEEEEEEEDQIIVHNKLKGMMESHWLKTNILNQHF